MDNTLKQTHILLVLEQRGHFLIPTKPQKIITRIVTNIRFRGLIFQSLFLTDTHKHT